MIFTIIFALVILFPVVDLNQEINEEFLKLRFEVNKIDFRNFRYLNI